MSRKWNIGRLLRKQLGKDAAAILEKVDKLLKQGVALAKIEEELGADLFKQLKKKIKRPPGVAVR